MDIIDRTSFKKFLDEVKKHNKLDTVLQTLQVKYEKEVAGEDDNKREDQLSEIADLLKNIESALKGTLPVKNVDDFKKSSISTPSSSMTELSTRLSDVSAENSSLGESIKSVVGGFKTGASIVGKGIGTTVTGLKNIISDPKTAFTSTGSGILTNTKEAIKKAGAGLVDIVRAEAGYTPAKERYAKEFVRQEKSKGSTLSERELLKIGKESYTKIIEKEKELKTVEESIKDSKKQGFTPLQEDIAKKESIINEIKEARSIVKTEAPVQLKDAGKLKRESINVEADNIESPQEIVADVSKKDLELTKNANKLLEDQLNELRKIGTTLSTLSVKPTDGSTIKQPSPTESPTESTGGLGLGEALAGVGSVAKKAGKVLTKGVKTVGKGALSLGKGIARFASTGTGKLLGSAAAVGLGAYSAYDGFNSAEDTKQAKLEEVKNKLDMGEITPEEAALARKEIGNSATVEKSEAIGKGTGMAAGTIAGGAAGAKLGATLGTFVGGPVGTAIGAGIGTIAGGALGAFGGTNLGGKAGQLVGQGSNWIGEKIKYIGEKEKSILDSTSLGAMFAKQGENVEQFNSGKDILGRRISSGSMFSKDAYEITDRSGNIRTVDKSDYYKIQELTQKGDISGAESILSDLKPIQSSNSGIQVANTSIENLDLTRENNKQNYGSQPIISSSVNNINTQSFVPIKPTPRPERTGSALDRYNDRIATY